MADDFGRTFLKEVHGTKISVTADGKFHAIIGAKHVTLANLRDLEKRLASVSSPALALSIHHPHDVAMPRRVEVSEVRPDRRQRYRYAAEDHWRLNTGYGEAIYALPDEEAERRLLQLARDANDAIDAYRAECRCLEVFTEKHLVKASATQEEEVSNGQ